jgi:hypothetical protein
LLIGLSGCTTEDKVGNPVEEEEESDTWKIQIEKTENSLLGHYTDIAVSVDFQSQPIGGFDLLLGYDASVLSFVQAELNTYFIDCGWEYFTYRYFYNGDCGDNCPSFLVRLVGLAETNNGANHPDLECIGDADSTALVTLTFFVTTDETYDCSFIPIQFYWIDCGDNAVVTPSGDSLFFNRNIYNADGDQIQDSAHGFPGYLGVPDDPCLNGDGVTPIRYVDYYNGGVQITCSDPSMRGDLNVNGIKNEIADAVLFTDYFLYGLEVFGDHIEASMAASDINGDKVALSVADLVYLVRIIVGDASQNPTPSLGEADILIRGGNITIYSPDNIGAAFFVFEVEGPVIVTPVLNASNMDMKYSYIDDQLRILIYNIGSEYIPAGQNLVLTVDTNALLNSAELATYDGAHIQSSIYVGALH